MNVNDQWDVLEEDTQKGKFLKFSLGKESYGIEILYVTEIIGLQPITELPELPEYIRGIINLRGKIIPVMDVRLRFSKQYREYNDRTCVIVVDIQSVSVGLIVDSVAEVINISDENIVLPPEIGNSFNNKYIKNLGKTENEVILILDCDKLLKEEDIAELNNIKN
ncbi:MAG: chemotaxis protein CheW [Bacillota bacterium]